MRPVPCFFQQLCRYPQFRQLQRVGNDRQPQRLRIRLPAGLQPCLDTLAIRWEAERQLATPQEACRQVVDEIITSLNVRYESGEKAGEGLAAAPAWRTEIPKRHARRARPLLWALTIRSDTQRGSAWNATGIA